MSKILQETGSAILLEDGSFLLQEDSTLSVSESITITELVSINVSGSGAIRVVSVFEAITITDVSTVGIPGSSLTFGKTTNGTNVQTFSGPRVYVCSATPSAIDNTQTGDITSGWGYVRVTSASSAASRMVIYSDDNGEPGTFLAKSDEVTVNWTTSTLTQYPFSGANLISVTGGTPYWIGFWFADPGTPSFEMKRDTTVNAVRFATEAYPGSGTPTTPFVAGGASNGPLAAYIEYTVDAGGSTLTMAPWENVTVSDYNYVNGFSWGGYDWTLRHNPTPGGPGIASWDRTNVTPPDSNGYVTLSIKNPGGAPVGCEMQSRTTGLGYGTYTLVVGSRLDTLDKNIVFGGFFPFYYGNPYIEIDACEASAWGRNTPVSILHSNWYGSDPEAPNQVLSTPESIVATTDTVTTHRMIWSPNQITFDTFVGEGTDGELLGHAVITSNVPVPATEKVYINFWVFGGGDQDGTDVPATDIVLRDFSYSNSYPIDSTASAHAAWGLKVLSF